MRCKQLNKQTKCNLDKTRPHEVFDRFGLVKQGRWRFPCRRCDQLSLYEFDICMRCGQYRNRNKQKKHDEEECPSLRVGRRNPPLERSMPSTPEAGRRRGTRRRRIEDEVVSPEETQQNDMDYDIFQFFVGELSMPSAELTPDRVWFDDPGVCLVLELRVDQAHARKEMLETIVPQQDKLVLTLPESEQWIARRTYHVLLEEARIVEDRVVLRFQSFSPKEAFFPGVSCLPVDEVTGTATFNYQHLDTIQTSITFYSRPTIADEKKTQNVIIRLAKALPKPGERSSSPTSSSTSTVGDNDDADGGDSSSSSSSSRNARHCAADRALVVMSRKLHRPVSLAELESIAANFGYLRHELVMARLGPIVREAVKTVLGVALDVVINEVLSFLGCDPQHPRRWACLRLQAWGRSLVGKTIPRVFIKPSPVPTSLKPSFHIVIPKPPHWPRRRTSWPPRGPLQRSASDVVLLPDGPASVRTPSTDPTYLVLWSAASKTAAMDRAERRLCHLLRAKNKHFEIVYVDITPGRKRDLYEIAGWPVALPCLTFGPEYRSYDTVLQKVNDGSFDDLLVLADSGPGFWTKPNNVRVLRCPAVVGKVF